MGGADQKLGMSQQWDVVAWRHPVLTDGWVQEGKGIPSTLASLWEWTGLNMAKGTSVWKRASYSRD